MANQEMKKGYWPLLGPSIAHGAIVGNYVVKLDGTIQTQVFLGVYHSILVSVEC